MLNDGTDLMLNDQTTLFYQISILILEDIDNVCKK